MKPFEAPQRSVKIKIEVNHFSLPGIGAGRVKMNESYSAWGNNFKDPKICPANIINSLKSVK